MKINLVVKSYLMNLSFKFCKDPCFRWGDISLFVNVYDLKLKIIWFSNPPKNAILSANLLQHFFCPLSQSRAKLKPAPSITSFLRKLPAVQDDKETDRKRMDIKLAPEFDNSKLLLYWGWCLLHPWQGEKEISSEKNMDKGEDRIILLEVHKNSLFCLPKT